MEDGIHPQYGDRITTLTTVEVMDTETVQRSTASRLPHPLHCSSHSRGDKVYLQLAAGAPPPPPPPPNGDEIRTITTVAVLNAETLQRSTASRLPHLSSSLWDKVYLELVGV